MKLIDPEAVEKCREAKDDEFLIKLARFVLAVPGFTTFIVGVARLLDRYGLLPKFLIDELPFYSGLFITNNASIGLHHVWHHIYNFGNVSLFMGLGSVLKEAKAAWEQYTRRVATGALNDVLGDAQMAVQPPLSGGRRLKIYYATQPLASPPTFALFINDEKLMHFSLALTLTRTEYFSPSGSLKSPISASFFSFVIASHPLDTISRMKISWSE